VPRLGEPTRDLARGSQEEVARAAGGIDRLQGEQRFRVIRVFGDLPVDDGVEGFLEQELNERVRRVVATGRVSDPMASQENFFGVALVASAVM
jgi:hypothetical protein